MDSLGESSLVVETSLDFDSRERDTVVLVVMGVSSKRCNCCNGVVDVAFRGVELVLPAERMEPCCFVLRPDGAGWVVLEGIGLGGRTKEDSRPFKRPISSINSGGEQLGRVELTGAVLEIVGGFKDATAGTGLD